MTYNCGHAADLQCAFLAARQPETKPEESCGSQPVDLIAQPRDHFCAKKQRSPFFCKSYQLLKRRPILGQNIHIIRYTYIIHTHIYNYIYIYTHTHYSNMCQALKELDTFLLSRQVTYGLRLDITKVLTLSLLQQFRNKLASVINSVLPFRRCDCQHACLAACACFPKRLDGVKSA